VTVVVVIMAGASLVSDIVILHDDSTSVNP